MLRSILHAVMKFLFRVLTRLDIQGTENIPERGAALLTSNHLHLIDAPLIFAAVERKDVLPLVGDTHRNTWWIRMLVDAVHGIWINRGGADTHALRAVLEHLQQGEMVGIAPEGTRSRTGAMLPAKTGTAYIADRANVPIVPAAIWGSEDALRQITRLRRPVIHIRFGPPYQLPPLGRADRSEALERNTTQIMLRIAAMLPKQYHGAYRQEMEAVAAEKV